MAGGPRPDPGPPVPRPVRAAAVLGFLLAAYTLVYALLLFTAISASIGYAVIGAVFLGISGLSAGGAVQALSGRGRGLLVAGGALFAGLTALGLVTALLSGTAGLWPVVLVGVGVAVVVLLYRPASGDFFAASRDRR